MSVVKVLALSVAMAVTQASATAAPAGRAAAPPIVHAARPAAPAGQHSWGLLAAGLIGLWAIGRRRIGTPGERALVPRRGARP